MNFDQWQESIRNQPRGRQRWATRQSVYEQLTALTEPVPDVATLCDRAEIAVSSFYTSFGPTSGDRLVDRDPPLSVAIVEAKAWSFDPARQGFRQACQAVHPSARTRVEALIQAVAAWAQEYPSLAVVDDFAAPITVIEELEGAFTEIGPLPDSGTGEELTRATVEYSVINSDEPSLGVLNAMRFRIAEAIGAWEDADELAVGETNVVEALASYAETLLASPSSRRHAASPRLTNLLIRLTRLIDAASK